MAQFTIRIDDELHARIKAAAAEDKRSRNGEIEWLLQVALEWRLVDRGTRALNIRSQRPRK